MVLVALHKLGVEVQDPRAMLIKMIGLSRGRKEQRDEALDISEKLEPLLDKLDGDDKGVYWFCRADLIEVNYGRDDPRVREYCLRSLAEGIHRVGAWQRIERGKPLTQAAFRDAVANTPGLDDLKIRSGIIK